MGAKQYVKEVIKEGKRVRWPKKDIFIPALITTVVVCVICAIILSLWDLLASKLLEALRQILGK